MMRTFIIQKQYKTPLFTSILQAEIVITIKYNGKETRVGIPTPVHFPNIIVLVAHVDLFE